MKYQIYQDGIKISETDSKIEFVNNLSMGVNYEFFVDDNNGNKSNVINAIIPIPDVPVIGVYERDLTWLILQWYSFGDKFKYNVYVNDVLKFENFVGDQLSLDDLKHNTEYKVTIKTVFEGRESDGITANISTIDYNNPVDVKNIVLDKVGINNISAKWDTIIDDEPCMAIVNNGVKEFELPGNSITFDNLKANKEYAITFKTKGLKSGKFSETSNMVVKTEEPYLFVNNVTDSEIKLECDISGYIIGDYSINVKVGDKDAVIDSSGSVVVSGLNPNTEYTVAGELTYNDGTDKFVFDEVKFKTLEKQHDYHLETRFDNFRTVSVRAVGIPEHDHTYNIIWKETSLTKQAKHNEWVTFDNVMMPNKKYFVESNIEGVTDSTIIISFDSGDIPFDLKSPLTNLKLVNSAIDSLTITWDKKITNLSVKYKVMADGKMFDTTENTFKIDGLKSKTEYEVTVYAYYPELNNEKSNDAKECFKTRFESERNWFQIYTSVDYITLKYPVVSFDKVFTSINGAMDGKTYTNGVVEVSGLKPKTIYSIGTSYEKDGFLSTETIQEAETEDPKRYSIYQNSIEGRKVTLKIKYSLKEGDFIEGHNNVTSERFRIVGGQNYHILYNQDEGYSYFRNTFISKYGNKYDAGDTSFTVPKNN